MRITSSTTATLALFVLASLPLGAVGNEQLVQKYGCTACHQADTKVVGPSWSSIRDKYKDGSETANQLAETIRSGSRKKWGPIEMPPQANVSESDAQIIAAWILGAK